MKKLTAMLLCILLLAGCAESYDGPTVAQMVLSEYEVVHTPWEDTDATVDRYVYAYDIYGNRVLTREYRDGELVQEERCVFDENGNKTKTTYWNHEGWFPYPESRAESTYDDQGRELSHVSYDFWGRETGRSEDVYDDEAHTHTIIYDGGSTTYYYDEAGVLLRSVSGDSETCYTYDETGNQTGWYSYTGGVLEEYVLTEYDDQGRKIHAARHLPDGTVKMEWKYVYDDELGTVTEYRPDGNIRIRYYYPDGRVSCVEDYNEEGRLTMTQTYYYTEVRVPAEEETP